MATTKTHTPLFGGAQLLQPIEQILTRVGIPVFGMCGFGSLRPLLPCRAAECLPKSARSALVCLFPYYVGAYPRRNLSRYAIVDDYHRVAGAMLEQACCALRAAYPQHSFACFIDNSPIREVSAAYRAGLGFIGKNGQLITERYGSYCFIGEIITSLDLPAAVPSAQSCGACRLCTDACPNGAILEHGVIDLAVCRSHITQKKGLLTEFEQTSITLGGFAWGCDICTDICPHNRAPIFTPIDGFYTGIVHKLTVENCRALCAGHAFGWRGAGVLQRNLQLLTHHSKPDEDVL